VARDIDAVPEYTLVTGEGWESEINTNTNHIDVELEDSTRISTDGPDDFPNAVEAKLALYLKTMYALARARTNVAHA
jgi:hypothetical protein